MIIVRCITGYFCFLWYVVSLKRRRHICNQIGNGKNSTMRNFDDLVEISNYCSGRGGGGTQRTTPAHTVAMAGKWEELASTAVENF